MAGSGKTYEMLWDCRYCGARKNLGKTHRHCPQCGAPQDATARYYPAEHEKVAVEDHVFVGADLQCAACRAWSSRAAPCCGGCGAPLAGAREAQLRADQVAGAAGWQQDSAQAARAEHQARLLAAQAGPHAPGAQATPPGVAFQRPAPQPTKGPSRATIVIAFVASAIGLVVAFLMVAAFWTRDAEIAVAGHSWTREIAIEQYRTVRDSAWCDQMPGGARNVSRSREVRSHRSVADGETCSNRRVDNGDGTFSERRECKTRYRDEPVYSDRCTYDVDRWSTVRTATAKGGYADEPQWPRVELARAGTGALGSEREGARTESYVVTFRTPDDETDECTYDQARWRRFRPGTKAKGQVRVLTGGIDCDEVAAP